MPEGLDLAEVFEAVPPGALFDAVVHTAALGIDRVVYFAKVIAFAHAAKAAEINYSYERALAVAETGSTSAAADDLQAVFNRVTAGAKDLQNADEPRTLAQLRTDVAVDLLMTGVTETGLGAGCRACRDR